MLSRILCTLMLFICLPVTNLLAETENTSWGSIKAEFSDTPAGKLVVSNVAKGSRDKLTQQESAIYELAKQRVVNLVCHHGDLTSFASGSFISSKGHILTAAHVVYNMFNTGDCECDVRQGSPAVMVGQAKTIFVPEAYKESLRAGDVRDAMRYDMAVLEMIPGSFSGEEISFYNLDPNYRSSIGHKVLVFGYPTEYKSIDRTLNSLRMFQGLSRIENLDYTYVVVNETEAAQGGSSGGVVFDVTGNQFTGLIFGASGDSDLMRRMLYSLTPWAINSVIFNETQQSLNDFVRDRATVENKPKSASEEGEIISNSFQVDYSWNLFQIRNGVSYEKAMFDIGFMKEDSIFKGKSEVIILRDSYPDMVFLVNGRGSDIKSVENGRWIYERFIFDKWEGVLSLQAGGHTFIFSLDGDEAVPK